MASEKLNTETARRLPPLNALRAFEAAARLGGVAKAAEELGVTPGAVSQHIRQLEDLFGQPLFRRLARGIALTDAAAAVLPALTDGLDRLREVGETLSAASDRLSVRLGAPGPFATLWLRPRLSAFEEQNPRYSVSLITDPEPGQLERFQLDLEIRRGAGGYAGCETHRLMTDSATPAVAPALLEDAGHLAPADAIAQLPLIHDAAPIDDPACPDWPTWLSERGITRPDAARGDHYAASDHVIAAAIAGRGVALVKRALAADALADGRLTPLPHGAIASLDWAYDLTWPKGRVLGAAARAVRDALTEAAAPYEHMGV